MCGTDSFIRSKQVFTCADASGWVKLKGKFGENPTRSRHCKRGVFLHGDSHPLLQREWEGEGKRRSSSQETCLFCVCTDFLRVKGKGEDCRGHRVDALLPLVSRESKAFFVVSGKKM
jgi:hypothetical protein